MQYSRPVDAISKGVFHLRKTFHVKISLISMKLIAGETHFQVNSFARSLVLTEAKRFFGSGLSRDQIVVQTVEKVCDYETRKLRVYKQCFC